MKKEYFIFIIAGLVLFEYVLDTISGPVVISIKNPFLFFQSEIITTYPLTAVSIGAKMLALIICVPLVLSLIKRKYVLKGIITFVLAAILELYAVQQLATGFLTTPIQWTLAFAFAGVGLLGFSAFYLIIGFFKQAHSFFSGAYNEIGNDEKFHL